MPEALTNLPLLTERQRHVIDRKAAGLTRREIAVALGISVAAVKQRLLRSRRRVRQRYGRALAAGGKPVRFRPFQLLPTDHI